MKYLIIALALTGCAKYEPLVDLRASDEQAQLYQRDLNECHMIVDNRIKWYSSGALSKHIMINRCLEGRGHSVLNSIK